VPLIDRAAPLSTRVVTLGADELTGPWERLANGDPQATVFSTPFFQRALFASFGPADPQGVVLEQEGQIVGLMPVVPLTLGRGVATLHEAGFLRCAHTLRNTLLVPQGVAPIEALLAALVRAVRCDSLLFQNLPVAGGMSQRLQDAASTVGLRADAPQAGRVLMFADFDDGYDAYLATRSGQFRRQLRKRCRELDAMGDLQIKRLTGAAIKAAMQDWRCVVGSSWQGQDSDAVGNTEQDWDFHHRLADNGALFLMYLDGRPIACLRQLEHNSVGFVHTMNYDQSLRNKAPGLVLFDHTMRDNASRGMRKMDFNGQSDFYARWATGETSHQTLRLYRQTLRGRAARHLRRIRKLRG